MPESSPRLGLPLALVLLGGLSAPAAAQATSDVFAQDGGDLRTVPKDTLDKVHFVIQDAGSCGNYEGAAQQVAAGYEVMKVGAGYCAFYPLDFVLETPDRNFVFREVFQAESGGTPVPQTCYQGHFYAGTLPRVNPQTGLPETMVILPTDLTNDGRLVRLPSCPPEPVVAPLPPATPVAVLPNATVVVEKPVIERPVRDPKPRKEPTPFHFPKIKPPHAAFVGRAGVGAGNESFSQYNIGLTEVGDQTPRPSLGGDFAWTPMGVDHGVYLGGTTDFVFGATGSGWDRSGGMVGWRQGPVALDLRVGVSGEPGDLPDAQALDGVPYGALGFALERPMPKLPGELVFAAQLGVDFIRLPNVDATDMYATLSVAWQGGGEFNFPERTPRPEAAVAVVEEEGPKVLKYTQSYGPVYTLAEVAVPAETAGAEVKKGEVVRLSEELHNGLMGSGDHPQRPAAVSYATYRALLSKNYPLSRRTYLEGYQAARTLGELQVAREALVLAMDTAPTSSEAADTSLSAEALQSSIDEIDNSYGFVHLEVPRSVMKKYSDAELMTVLGLTYPVPPDQREVVASALEVLKETGEYEGFFPLAAATAFMVVPYKTEQRVQVFTAQR